MKILHALEEITDGEPRVFVLGFFDGCHLGHQAVFKEAAKLAEEKSAGIGVITFYPHPMSVLAPGIRVPLLQSEEEKAESFRKAGMDLAVFIRPTKEFLSETAESFLKNLADIPGIKGIVTGDNFSFGKGASGNVSSMKSYFEGSDVAVVTAPLVSEGGKVLSSTTEGTIRCQATSFTASTEEMISWAFRQRTFACPMHASFLPTASMRRRQGSKGNAIRPSQTSGRIRPLATAKKQSKPSSLIIRGEVKFDSVDALKAQIESDIETAKKILF